MPCPDCRNVEKTVENRKCKLLPLPVGTKPGEMNLVDEHIGALVTLVEGGQFELVVIFALGQ